MKPAVQEKPEPIQAQDQAQDQKSDAAYLEKQHEKWRGFVDEVAKSGEPVLVSLLRSCSLEGLDDKKLVIGTKNKDVFTKEKIKRINSVAAGYFREGYHVEIITSENSPKNSINYQQELRREERIAQLKKEAREDVKVREIQEIFPKSRIIDITLLEE
ncbi:MAG: hypothetical protein OEY59_03010 [Deltaproteobacteria bacterium]|nr:hypothetical protein [Deltaproteobacteria bacterium]